MRVLIVNTIDSKWHQYLSITKVNVTQLILSVKKHATVGDIDNCPKAIKITKNPLTKNTAKKNTLRKSRKKTFLVVINFKNYC